MIREDAGATIISVGPMLDPVLEAVDGLDVSVVYTAMVRPFPGELVVEAMGTADLVLVEPYLEGTSAAEVARSIDRPHRLLCIGVPAEEHRRYGTGAHHIQAHGLDVAGIRARIVEFLR